MFKFWGYQDGLQRKFFERNTSLCLELPPGKLICEDAQNIFSFTLLYSLQKLVSSEVFRLENFFYPKVNFYNFYNKKNSNFFPKREIAMFSIVKNGKIVVPYYIPHYHETTLLPQILFPCSDISVYPLLQNFLFQCNSYLDTKFNTLEILKYSGPSSHLPWHQDNHQVQSVNICSMVLFGNRPFCVKSVNSSKKTFIKIFRQPFSFIQMINLQQFYKHKVPASTVYKTSTVLILRNLETIKTVPNLAAIMPTKVRNQPLSTKKPHTLGLMGLSLYTTFESRAHLYTQHYHHHVMKSVAHKNLITSSIVLNSQLDFASVAYCHFCLVPVAVKLFDSICS